jgi:hypothetical protein
MLLLMTGLYPASCLAAPVLEVYCFTDGKASPIRFEMRSYLDPAIQATTALLKYEHGVSWIALVEARRLEVSIAREGPSEVTETWYEVSQNGISGEYELVHQGTSMISVAYTNRKTKRTYNFRLDVESSAGSGCQWR